MEFKLEIMNRLLERQIQRYFNGIENVPAEVLPFLDAINRSYTHYEEGQELLERAMEVSSEELVEANQQLREETAKQKTLLSKLQSSIKTVLSIQSDTTIQDLPLHEGEDLLRAANYLEHRLQLLQRFEEEVFLIKSYIDQSSDAIQVCDLDGRLIFINKKAEEWLHTTAENCIGRFIYEVDAKIPTPNAWERLKKGLEQNKDGLLLHRLQRLDTKATSRLIESSVSEIQFNEKQLIIGVSRDITEREQNQKEREHLIEKLKDANTELENFAYIVSHDLKAPLRGISTLTDWLAADYKEPLGEDGSELIDLLQTRVNRMHNLIEGILQYSRIGRKETTNTTISLEHLLAEVIDSLSAPPHIEVKIITPLPTFFGNETSLRQVFQNFISNAIKYNDKPQGKVMVGCNEKEEEWEFFVEDNGPGIDKRYHEKIFQIFQTLHHKDDFESTGIGLTIVKKIIQQNGGSIRIESEVGKGTTFFFTFRKDLVTEPS